jgi:hypothetical protein
MYTEQFIEPFEAENPGFKWETIEVYFYFYIYLNKSIDHLKYLIV